jgi:hypothetical protein
VGGHVAQMRCDGGRFPEEEIGGGLGSSRPGDRTFFHGVNVDMVEADVVWEGGERGLDHSESFGDLRRRLTGGGPPKPGAEIHQAIGIERWRVSVLRIQGAELLVNRFHGHRVVDAELLGIASRRAGRNPVAFRQCFDIELLRLAGIRAQIVGTRALLYGKHHAWIIDGNVQVAAGRQRDTPVGHREIGIRDGGLMERAHGRFGIKPVEEREPLIEEILSTLVGRADLMAGILAILVQRIESDGPIKPPGLARRVAPCA